MRRYYEQTLEQLQSDFDLIRSKSVDMHKEWDSINIFTESGWNRFRELAYEDRKLTIVWKHKTAAYLLKIWDMPYNPLFVRKFMRG